MITLLILSSFILQHNANRLLKAIGCTDDVGICPDGTDVSRDDNNNCEFYPCPDGRCITADKCVNPNTNQCESEAQCFAYPCAVSDPGCILPEVCVANYCGGCHALCEVPTCANSNPCPKDTFCDDTPSGPVCLNIGDTCGSPPDDCPALRCLCGLCPNRKTQFGCCSTCVVEDFGSPTCSGVINQKRVCKCGGFGELCVEYFDGCNTCVCDADGKESCTEMACKTMEIARCNKCIFGYVPNNDGECKEVKKCDVFSVCDGGNGFFCRVDFVCIGQWGKNDYCDRTNIPTVCVDIDGSCVNDLDCVVGYKCVIINNGGNGICSRYE